MSWLGPPCFNSLQIFLFMIILWLSEHENCKADLYIITKQAWNLNSISFLSRVYIQIFWTMVATSQHWAFNLHRFHLPAIFASICSKKEVLIKAIFNAELIQKFITRAGMLDSQTVWYQTCLPQTPPFS